MAKLTQFEMSPEQSAPLDVANGGNGHLPALKAAAANGNAPEVVDVPALNKPQAVVVEALVMEDTYVFPASREQTRYWMLAQLDPESTASNMAIAFELEGEVSDRFVEQAIAALTMRHEALRTIFRLEAGVLSQVVLARPLYQFTVEDLTSITGDEQAVALEATVSRHGHTIIDLESGPVLHAHLVHLSPTRHVIALTMNHIVCDGWSNGLLIRDFTVIYEALLTGEEPVLPELPFQFADFSLWQNEYLTSPAADEAAAFWKAHITSDLLALDLPTDHARPSGRSFPGHIESALLPKAIDEQLKAYCRKTGSTKHIVLLAAFEAFCARYTGQSEFLLGSTIANRTQPGMEDVVGRFANPQIIVANAGGDPSFHALEQRVRDWETAAYTHQDLPFSRVIEDFQIDQAGATSQFLQVWFLYQKAFMQPQAGRTIRVTPRRSVSGGVDFDLLVSVVERAEGPRVQFEYNTLIFNPDRIRGLIDGFIELLGGALAEPERPLSEVAHVAAPPIMLAPEATVQQLTPSDSRQGLLAVVAMHAADRPVAIASSDGKTSLTWQQLEQQSTAVAEELRRSSPQVSMLVVHLCTCTESMVALLAGIKLGCPIMPLPPQADGAIVSDCLRKRPDAVLLASQRFGLKPWLAYESFATLAATSMEKGGADVSTSLPGSAQLLFLTDVSTLSFAEVASESLEQNVAMLLPALSLNADASILAFAPETPLDATLDLLLAMRSGAQLNFGIAPGGDSKSQAIAEQVAACEAGCIFATSAQAKAMAACGWVGDRRVSLVVRGGRLPASLKQTLTLRLKAAFYLCSTPLAGGVAGLQFLSGERAKDGFLPVGSATLVLKNAEGLVLPAGAFGEVCVRPASRDASSLNNGSVDLRTGYMARSSTAGVVELQDDETRYVQLRGHRICLGDIEDAALSLPFISAAAAAMPQADSLVLYLAAKPANRDRNAVQQHLIDTLPSHLVPSDVIWLDALPIAADGRVDAARLPQREVIEPAHEATLNTLPLNKVEEKLASIWKEVLGLRSIDIHKSFFALGGSSLLLVRLFARVNKAFDTSLPITTIFDAQTIAALALMLGGQAEMSHLVQVQTAGTKPPLFMVHSYLLYQGLSNSLGPNQPFYGLRELEEDGHLTIEERVDHYTREIRKLQPHGPYHVAGWCAAGPLTVEVARKLLNAGEQVAYLALFDSWLPGYIESIQTANADGSWRPYRTVGSKLNFHRNRIRGLGFGQKTHYVWMAVARIARDTRYRIYLHNWERLHKLSEKYHFQLPQFMHNTSLETFAALKEYQGRKLPVRLTLIRASESREVVGAAASCGWEQVAEKGVEVLWAPGDHETMFIGKNLKVTSEIVQLGLEASALRELNAGAGGAQQGATRMQGVMHVDCPST